MRSDIVGCSVNDGLLTEALGAIYYQDADMKSLPTAAPNQGPTAQTSPRFCDNDPLTQTVPAFQLKASTPGLTKNLDIRMKDNGTHMLLNFGDNSFRADFNDPILQRALVGMNSNYEKTRNVWNVGPAKTMRAVVFDYDNAPHPVSATLPDILATGIRHMTLRCYCYIQTTLKWQIHMRKRHLGPELMIV
jgi:hypothetical protein